MRRAASKVVQNGGGVAAHLMNRPAGAVTQAIGWVLVAVAMVKNLNPTDASVVLFALVIAELFAQLLLTRIDKPRSSSTSNLVWEDEVGELLLRWFLLSVSVSTLTLYGLIPFFHGHEYSLICVLGLCLSLAMLKVICAFRGFGQTHGCLLVKMRLVLLASGIVGFAKFGSLNADLVLSFAIGLVLITLMIVSAGFDASGQLAKATKARSDQLDKALDEFTPFLLRYADLLILPWVMLPTVAMSYLIARGLAQLVPVVLDQLGERVTNTLARAFTAGSDPDFVSGAARTNLGFLLIGGAATLAVFGFGVHVPQAFNLNPSHFHKFLFWLTLAQAAPVVFGATCLLMNIAAMRNETIGLSLIGVVTVWSITVVFGLKGPQYLAQLYAYVQMAITAISAVMLGLRFGIWPGLTALLFRQIRLL